MMENDNFDENFIEDFDEENLDMEDEDELIE